VQIGLAQINSTLGDFSGNREKILAYVNRAKERRCELVVFPELALFGYQPMDLLERDSIVQEQLKELNKLKSQMPAGILAIVGCVTRAPCKKTAGRENVPHPLESKRYFNSAAVIEKGKPVRFVHKTLLPNYDVFDEVRHFASEVAFQKKPNSLIRWRGKRIVITLCEDIWEWQNPQNPMRAIPTKGVDLVVNLSGSPFTKSKLKQREKVWKETTKHFRAPLCYVNLVGAQDEILYDGRSAMVDANGLRRLELVAFEEDLGVFDLDRKNPMRSEPAGEVEILRRGLVTGIRDFVQKTGLRQVHFGLSGGIDSALVACLAVDAIGPKSVTALTLPGKFNDPKSRTMAEVLAKRLGIRTFNLDIWPAYESLKATFESCFGSAEFGLVDENMQARIRGLLLMAFSNREGSLLLSTGNKSEYAAGYTTLYGDQCGGLAPLGDLLKSDVYRLARYYNQQTELIPSWIIERPPSAELRPNQVDEDSLPPYRKLDAAVEKIIEKRRPASSKIEKWILNASYRSEFKRWQAPPILKVTDHAFGRGRRLPITHRARV
jgi:NAD+ synthase (glutamine-hydrolysing)